MSLSNGGVVDIVKEIDRYLLSQVPSIVVIIIAVLRCNLKTKYTTICNIHIVIGRLKT